MVGVVANPRSEVAVGQVPGQVDEVQEPSHLFDAILRVLVGIVEARIRGQRPQRLHERLRAPRVLQRIRPLEADRADGVLAALRYPLLVRLFFVLVDLLLRCEHLDVLL